MSDPAPPPPPESPQPPPPLGQQRGCASIALSIIMFLVGLILLLPGLCALFFAAVSITSPNASSDLGGWIVTGLLIGALGVFLIRLAFRRPRA